MVIVAIYHSVRFSGTPIITQLAASMYGLAQHLRRQILLIYDCFRLAKNPAAISIGMSFVSRKDDLRQCLRSITGSERNRGEQPAVIWRWGSGHCVDDSFDCHTYGGPVNACDCRDGLFDGSVEETSLDFGIAASVHCGRSLDKLWAVIIGYFSFAMVGNGHVPMLHNAITNNSHLFIWPENTELNCLFMCHDKKRKIYFGFVDKYDYFASCWHLAWHKCAVSQNRNYGCLRG